MTNSGQAGPGDTTERNRDPSNLGRALSEETIAQNKKSLVSCLAALSQLQRNIKSALLVQLPPDVLARINHAENLATSVANLLASPIEFTTADGAQAVAELGRYTRAYDLEFLREASANASSNLKHRPTAAGPTLHVLVPLLQAWIDFVIPGVLDDLEVRAREADIAIHVPERAQQVLSAYHRERRVSGLERQAAVTVENLKQAAGEGGKERLAQTFETRGTEEAASAVNWNRLVMLFVALGIALPLVAISFGTHFLGHLPNSYSIVVKALIGLPMFALATYSGRISSQHRKMAQHMKLLVAQIDSVKAYVEPLPTEIQQDIIATLGKRAFSEPGLAAATDGTVGIPPEQLMPAVEKALDILKVDRK